jgi:hypothetical protein
MGDQPHIQPPPSLRKNNRQCLFKKWLDESRAALDARAQRKIPPCLCSETKRENTARVLVTTDRCIPTPVAALAVVIVLLHLHSYASLNDGDTFWEMRRCANVTECTYTNLDSIAYYTHLGYMV